MAETPAAPVRARDQADVRLVGASAQPIRDLYHAAIGLPWSLTLLGIVVAFLFGNLLFAVAFVIFGGVAGAHRYSLADAFFFSVQTMGTIGYGAMYPASTAAQVIVVIEAVVGMIFTALATGLIFAKFSRSTARIVFTREAVIAPMDGVPTLMFRVGNERKSLIVEATLRVSLVRTERTAEGKTFYRLYDLALARDRSQAMSRSWTVMHPIVAPSPLMGATPETMIRDEVELLVSVVGTDETSLQAMHARHTYYHDEIVWGAHHKDILREEADGTLVLDLRQFHEVEPSVRTETFPYGTG